MKANTSFASPERSDTKDLKSGRASLLSEDNLQAIIDEMPILAMVINENRQILLCNQNLMDLLKIESPEEFLGKRPGEAMACIYANKGAGGCGTSEECRYCGAVNVILDSMKEKKRISGDCRVSIDGDDGACSLDLKVTATPLSLENSNYTIVFISDISAEKRRSILERVFFHDIKNTAGGIMGLSEVISTSDHMEGQETREMVNMLKDASNRLIEEIKSQQQILEAEKGSLKPLFTETSSKDLVESAVHLMSHHRVTLSRNISLKSDNVVSCLFKTDISLCTRVLVNLVKNAVEASEKGASVEIQAYTDGDDLIFEVHNQTVMSESVKRQIFHRSFSTKGHGRGLGTYSIKLFSEKYLRGKVSFTSEDEKGTSFFLRVPANFEE
ncbi:MAG: PAS domain-containing sensor histidine kinase [Planctomycetes bacterium]|nr:PAS domain-containing sensor histidine kinase [Planctomycetota bacterium]